MMVIELDQIMRGGEPLLRTSGMVASRSVKKVRHRRDSYLVIPIAVSGVATPENKVYRNSLALSSISKKVGTRCRSPFCDRFLEGFSSPFKRLAEHLTALHAWCKQCLPGW